MSSTEFSQADAAVFKNPAYVLPSDTEEGKRLNAQHATITAGADGRLVFAPVELRDGDRVLDGATGTGVWTLELASRSPKSVLFTAVDISTHLFPSSEHTPANVTFSQQSVLDLPADFESSFTLVNQRLLIGALTTENWLADLKSLYRVTKPGGWVQIAELYPLKSDYTAMPRFTRLLAYQEALYKARNLDFSCAKHVADWAQEAGFRNIASMTRDLVLGSKAAGLPHDYSESLARYFLFTADGVVACGAASSKEEYVEAIQAARQEWDEAEEPVPYSFVWTWGQKPLDTA